MSGLDRSGKVFLGCGWAFPFRVEPAIGRVATAADEEDIRPSDLNGKGNEVAIESLELANEGIRRIQ